MGYEKKKNAKHGWWGKVEKRDNGGAFIFDVNNSGSHFADPHKFGWSHKRAHTIGVDAHTKNADRKKENTKRKVLILLAEVKKILGEI